MERVAKPVDEATGDGEDAGQEEGDDADKLTTSKLARKLGCKTAEITEKLVASGPLEMREGKPYLTDKGKASGGEFRMSQRFGAYFPWPAALSFCPPHPSAGITQWTFSPISPPYPNPILG